MILLSYSSTILLFAFFILLLKGKGTRQKNRSIATVFFLFLLLLRFGFEQVALPHYTPMYFVLTTLLALVLGTILFVGLQTAHKETTKWGIFGVLFLLGAALITFIIIDGFQNQHKYDTLKLTEAEVHTLDFNEKEIYKVDQDFALNKISKSLSEVPKHSFYQIKSINLMKVNDELLYVAELGHKDIFKWLKKKEIPGYFTLSATDMQGKVEFVPTAYTYSGNAFFGKRAERRLFKQTKDEKAASTHFEIDDNGVPYYIQPLQTPVNTLSGKTATGVATLNLISGKVTTYPLQKAPSWVEDAIGSDLAAYVADVRAQYPKGSFNFSNEDKTTPNMNGEESGMKPVFIGGKKYYFVEFSTYENEGDSMQDALLIDARTEEALRIDFNEPLMDSNGAVKIGEKRYIEKQWHGVNPMLYNIDGAPTWVYSLLDSNNYHQRFVLVNAKTHSITSDDAALGKAMAQYKEAVAKGLESTQLADTDAVADETAIVTVKQLHVLESEEGFTFYLRTEDDQQFSYATNTPDDMMFVAPGDQLELQFKTIGDRRLILSVQAAPVLID